MTRCRLDWISRSTRDSVSIDEMRSEATVTHYSIPNFDEFGGASVEPSDSIESGKLRVDGGELLVSRLNPRKQRVLITAQHDGLAVCSGEFVVLRASSGALLRFLYWRLLAEDTRQHLAARVRSVTRSQQRVDPEEIRKLWIDLPSLEQQQLISDFLDSETARIDQLLAEQRHQLDLIEEHRYALVSRAVGARLGGDRSPLAGALGTLSQGWRLTPLRFVATIQSGLTLGKSYDGPTEARSYIRVANVQDGELDLKTVTTIKVPIDVARRHELQPGDVLMTEGGDNDKLGRGTVWNDEIVGCLHQNHVFAIRPNCSVVRPQYLAALTTSAWGRAYFTATAHQTTNLASTNRSKIGGFLIPLPPIEEQDSLLSELGAMLESLDEVRSELSTQADLLLEHRQALITAAVTGALAALQGAA